jgi:hypothetical protein
VYARWNVIVESEKSAGVSAPGPANRSFPINTPGSPVSIDWLPHTSDMGSNWSVHLKVDQHTYPHPNGSGYFTYMGMQDHVDLNGGPLPDPAHLQSDHVISYDQWTPGSDDAARMLVGAQFYWGGKSHILEIILASSQWGDGHPDPEAIFVKSDWYGDGSAEYVVLNGAAFGLVATPGQASAVSIPWATLLARVIAKGWFTPIGTLPSVTQAVYIGIEAKNQSVADVWNTNFRILKINP